MGRKSLKVDFGDLEEIRTGTSAPSTFTLDGPTLFINTASNKAMYSDGESSFVDLGTIGLPLADKTSIRAMREANQVSTTHRSESSGNLNIDVARNGKWLFTLEGSRELKSYELQTPYDLSSALYRQTGDLSSELSGGPKGLALGPNGDRCVAVDANANVVEYEFFQTYDPAGATAATVGNLNYTEIKAACLGDGGNRVYTDSENEGSIIQYNLDSPYAVDTATEANQFNLPASFYSGSAPEKNRGMHWLSPHTLVYTNHPKLVEIRTVDPWSLANAEIAHIGYAPAYSGDLALPHRASTQESTRLYQYRGGGYDHITRHPLG